MFNRYFHLENCDKNCSNLDYRFCTELDIFFVEPKPHVLFVSSYFLFFLSCIIVSGVASLEMRYVCYVLGMIVYFKLKRAFLRKIKVNHKHACKF